eukprot:jgi/Botrbrau1/3624/Bobra.0204s0017.2
MGSVLPALLTRRTWVRIPLEKGRKKNKLGDMGRNEEATRYRQDALAALEANDRSIEGHIVGDITTDVPRARDYPLYIDSPYHQQVVGYRRTPTESSAGSVESAGHMWGANPQLHPSLVDYAGQIGVSNTDYGIPISPLHQPLVQSFPTEELLARHNDAEGPSFNVVEGELADSGRSFSRQEGSRAFPNGCMPPDS